MFRLTHAPREPKDSIEAQPKWAGPQWEELLSGGLLRARLARLAKEMPSVVIAIAVSRGGGYHWYVGATRCGAECCIHCHLNNGLWLVHAFSVGSSSVLVSGPQTAFRLTHARGEVSVICNLIPRRKVYLVYSRSI